MRLEKASASLSLVLASVAGCVFTGTLRADDLKLSDLMKQFNAGHTTQVGENPQDVTLVYDFFTIIGGGALVLCEPKMLTKAGPDGACADTMVAMDQNGGKEGKGSVGDVLGFPVKQDTIRFYSDPFMPADAYTAKFLVKGNITTASLTAAFTDGKKPRIDYVEEGGFYDERDGSSGKLINDVNKFDATAYVTTGTNKNGNRLFILYSDTGGSEPDSNGGLKLGGSPVPEPASALLVGTVLFPILWKFRRRFSNPLVR
jgi:hypothetical protein